jgi:hypothetical protein
MSNNILKCLNFKGSSALGIFGSLHDCIEISGKVLAKRWQAPALNNATSHFALRIGRALASVSGR